MQCLLEPVLIEASKHDNILSLDHAVIFHEKLQLCLLFLVLWWLNTVLVNVRCQFG
jgi:hypothetical protein